MDIERYLAERAAWVEESLQRYLPEEGEGPGEIYRAMRYSLLAGGKRLRPILLLAGCEAVGGDAGAVMPAACAAECVHTYSLIHDDLPSMDDDDLRRGKPTSHKVFGEAMAVLAGDALLSYAFELLMRPQLVESCGAERACRAAGELARAAGPAGMVGGQVMDLHSAGSSLDLAVLEELHWRKTGALIRASVWCGGHLGGGGEEEVEALGRYGARAGLAFQVVDDILDVEGDAVALGKATGTDRKQDKATFPALFGLEESKRRARRLAEEAIEDLALFGARKEPLAALARYIVHRRC
ncbi:MAG: polyprenyl synthetase family protein [Nitrospinota bacterium]